MIEPFNKMFVPRVMTYSKVTDVGEGISVARVIHIYDHICEIQFLRIPQSLSLISRTELLQLRVRILSKGKELMGEVLHSRPDTFPNH